MYNKYEVNLMDAYVIIVVIFSILTMLLLIGLYFVNRIYVYKSKVDNSYNVINELMDERLDYIARFANFVENELKSESNLVKRLEKVVDEFNSKEKDIKFVKKTSKYLVELKALDKVYPMIKDKYLVLKHH